MLHIARLLSRFVSPERAKINAKKQERIHVRQAKIETARQTHIEKIQKAFGIYFSKEGHLKIKATHLQAHQAKEFKRFLISENFQPGKDIKIHREDKDYTIVVAGYKARQMLENGFINSNPKDPAVAKILNKIKHGLVNVRISADDLDVLKNRVQRKAGQYVDLAREEKNKGSISWSFNRYAADIVENCLRFMRGNSRNAIEFKRNAGQITLTADENLVFNSGLNPPPAPVIDYEAEEDELPEPVFEETEELMCAVA